MSQTYKIRPSNVLDIQDNYLAFCFDEACGYIVNQIKEDKTPRFLDEEKPSNNSNLINFMNTH